MRNPILPAVAAALCGVLLAGCGATPPAPPSPGAPAASPGSASAAPRSGYGSPVEAGRIESDDVRESSGLSASECQDVLWTQNDSGNDPLIFGMDTEGRSLGTWQVQGARNVDWESISSSRDESGRCFLTIADIGDNDGTRTELDVYRVPEPTATGDTADTDAGSPLQTEPAQAMTFRYPSGAANAETLLVHPRTGDLYVVTKEESGPAGVFRMPPAFDSGAPVTGEKVADIAVPADPEGRFTGGSMSPDGRRLMLCNLEGGYELVLPDGATDPDAIWRQQPTAVDLGDRPQGEGVSYARDGLALFASSEKKNAPLFRIERRS
jgi:hypothetical protein